MGNPKSSFKRVETKPPTLLHAASRTAEKGGWREGAPKNDVARKEITLLHAASRTAEKGRWREGAPKNEVVRTKSIEICKVRVCTENRGT